MLGPPRLWTWFTTEWCAVPPHLAWLWWRAIYKAQWSFSPVRGGCSFWPLTPR
jgi:hypothetical protein